MRKTLLLILGLLALIVLAWLVLSRVSSPQTVEESTTQPVVEEAVEEAVEDAVAEVENPIEGEIPDINPAAKTNPFGDAYKNQFE